MFCSKCGSSIAADASFCTVCGTPQARAAVIPAPGVSVPANVGVAGFSGGRATAYAGFWLRFVAHIIDGLIVGTGVMALFIPLILLTGGAAQLAVLQDHRGGPPDPVIIASMLSVLFTFIAAALLVTWLYYAYLESSDWQATVGKRVMSIYVTSLTGQPITFLHATGRYFSKIVTGLIPFGIGYIMAGFTERRQALHDMIAGTLVLRR